MAMPSVSGKRPAGWLRTVEPTCAAIAALLYPNAEVVVHDVAADRIVAIWNPFSGRKVGDPALLGELPASWPSEPFTGPYEKVLIDGRRLSSVSSVVTDPDGTVRGLLCINFDRSAFDAVVKLLSDFMAPVTDRPAELFSRDWREQIALVVDQECRRRGLRRDALTRSDRLLLVTCLDEQGLFATRRAADHAARALGTSRATVYALLKETRT
jgi:D-arginine utilization repressor